MNHRLRKKSFKCDFEGLLHNSENTRAPLASVLNLTGFLFRAGTHERANNYLSALPVSWLRVKQSRFADDLTCSRN